MTQSLNTNRLGVLSLLLVFVFILCASLSSSTLAQSAPTVEPKLSDCEVRKSNIGLQTDFNKRIALSETAQGIRAFAQLERAEPSSIEDSSPKEKTNVLSDEDESGSDAQTNNQPSDSVAASSDSSISAPQGTSAPEENEALEDQKNVEKASSKKDPSYAPLPEPVLTTDETVEVASTDELIESHFPNARQMQSNPATLAFVIGGAAAVISVVLLAHGLANAQTDYSSELQVGSAVTGAVAVVALGTGLYLLLTNTTDESVQASHQRRSLSSTIERRH